MNYTYILKCSDGSFYTGWTNDLNKRLAAHNSGKGAKYTKSRTPVELVYYEISDTKEEAMSREWHIKQLSKIKKQKLIDSIDKAELDKFNHNHTHSLTEDSEVNSMSETTIHPHAHYHSPEEKKKQLNRISKAIGHLQHVKTMMENDEDCADVLIQLSAVNSALHNLGKEIINEHMTHCIVHAIENGDMKAVEEFQKSVKKFL